MSYTIPFADGWVAAAGATLLELQPARGSLFFFLSTSQSLHTNMLKSSEEHTRTHTMEKEHDFAVRHSPWCYHKDYIVFLACRPLLFILHLLSFK
jgi:hypothetical protein